MASSARIDELRRKFDENPRRYFAPLANEYRKAGDAEQAIFICQEYLPQQPGHMSGHIVYGQALFDLARYDDARAVFETALALDPENLIALRHLGDIARTMGDLNTARTWYQRVLEADPRNEEIAQLLLSLLSNDSEQPTTSTSMPTPLANAAVGLPAHAATPTAPSPGIDNGFYSDSARDAASDAAPGQSSPTSETYHAPDEVRKVSPHAPNEAELLDLDDFDLGGVPLSELHAASATPIYQPAQPFDETTASGIEMPPMIESEDVPADTDAISHEPAPPADAEIEVDFLTIDVESSPYDSFQPDPFAIATSPISTEFDKEDDTPIRSSDTESVESVLDSSAEVSSAEPFPVEPVETRSASSVESSLDSSADADFEPGFTAWSTPRVQSTDANEPSDEPSDEPLNEPVVELETDLHLGLTDDGTAQETVADASPTVDGLETFEAGTFVASPTESGIPEAEGLEIESFFDAVHPADAHEPIAAAPEAFVTETMAELYLEQGHLESALAIYHKLAEQRPDDTTLAARMQMIEHRIYGPPARPTDFAAVNVDGEVSASASSIVATHPTGPTIREFLSNLIRRSPLTASSSDDTPNQPDTIPVDETISDAYASEDYAFDGYGDIDEPLAAAPAYEQPIAANIDTPLDEYSFPVGEARPTSSASETVGGSLGALFSGADATASDAAAAITLSQAFASTDPGTAALEGMPAHRAKDELSLDHVFKGNSTPRAARDGDSFSFDQFFSEGVAEGPVEQHVDPGASQAEGVDDIAQFNAWLNGLKKT